MNVKQIGVYTVAIMMSVLLVTGYITPHIAINDNRIEDAGITQSHSDSIHDEYTDEEIHYMLSSGGHGGTAEAVVPQAIVAGGALLAAYAAYTEADSIYQYIGEWQGWYPSTTTYDDIVGDLYGVDSTDEQYLNDSRNTLELAEANAIQISKSALNNELNQNPDATTGDVIGAVRGDVNQFYSDIQLDILSKYEEANIQYCRANEALDRKGELDTLSPKIPCNANELTDYSGETKTVNEINFTADTVTLANNTQHTYVAPAIPSESATGWSSNNPHGDKLWSQSGVTAQFAFGEPAVTNATYVNGEGYSQLNVDKSLQELTGNNSLTYNTQRTLTARVSHLDSFIGIEMGTAGSYPAGRLIINADGSLSYNDANGDTVALGTSVSEGDHIAITADSSGFEYFVNGNLVGTYSHTPTFDSEMKFGDNENGRLNDLRYYDTKLTSQQITDVANDAATQDTVTNVVGTTSINSENQDLVMTVDGNQTTIRNDTAWLNLWQDVDSQQQNVINTVGSSESGYVKDVISQNINESKLVDPFSEVDWRESSSVEDAAHRQFAFSTGGPPTDASYVISSSEAEINKTEVEAIYTLGSPIKADGTQLDNWTANTTYQIQDSTWAVNDGVIYDLQGKQFTIDKIIQDGSSVDQVQHKNATDISTTDPTKFYDDVQDLEEREDETQESGNLDGSSGGGLISGDGDVISQIISTLSNGFYIIIVAIAGILFIRFRE